MASTYTTRLRFEKQADGENAATWGQKANTGFDLMDDALGGMVTVATTGGTTTLTTNNGAADQARMAIIKVTGALISNVTIAIPSQTKKYTVWNATSGAFTVSVKAGAGVAFAVAQGKRLPIICDGTDCFSAVTDAVGMGLGTAALLDVGATASKVVQLDGSARLPAVDGSLLTGLSGSGETNTGSNVGAGVGPFKQKSGVDLQFYTFATTNDTAGAAQPSSLSVSLVGNVITFAYLRAGPSGGE